MTTTHEIKQTLNLSIASGEPFLAPAWAIAALTQDIEGSFFIFEEDANMKLGTKDTEDGRHLEFNGRPRAFGATGVSNNIGSATPTIDLEVLTSVKLDPDEKVTLIIDFDAIALTGGSEIVTKTYLRPEYDREYPGGLSLNEWNALVDLEDGRRSLVDQETLPKLLTEGYVVVEPIDFGFDIVLTDKGQELVHNG